MGDAWAEGGSGQAAHGVPPHGALCPGAASSNAPVSPALLFQLQSFVVGLPGFGDPNGHAARG